MTHVLVTGGSGKLGRACVRDLVGHGYEVTNVDIVPSPDALCPHVRADLADFGQTLEVLAGVDEHPAADAVVHLAAIPAPGLVPNAEVFRLNTLSTYNVFSAAEVCSSGMGSLSSAANSQSMKTLTIGAARTSLRQAT